MEKDNKNNVVIFPKVVQRGGTSFMMDVPSAEDGINKLVETVTEFAKSSSSVFCMTVDKETGNPSLFVGGEIDVCFINMFLDLLKEEMRKAYMEEVGIAEEDEGL